MSDNEQPLRTSSAGLDLIKRFEGLALEAYQDIAGVWTIGYGHTGPEVDAAVKAADLQNPETRSKKPEEGASDRLGRSGLWFLDSGFWVKDGRVVITESQADTLLREDLKSREALLDEWAADHGLDLNQNEFDALISFIFNIGFAAFARSTAARRLIAGDRAGAAEALTWWNKASVNGGKVEVQGLTRRRAAEKALFLASTAKMSEACSSQ